MMRRHQGGFSLVSATFIVVVVAMLAGYLVNLGNAQRAATSFSLQGLRAHAAVQSGMEWAIARVLRDGACVAPGSTFALDGAGLEELRVSVDCVATTVTEGARTYPMFRLTASARRGTEGGEDYYSRRLTASIVAAP
ncbi:MAG: hypothetical protein AB7O21_18810 [Gammaproteobacteria bacterium]